MKLRSGKAYNYITAVSRKRKVNSSKEHKYGQLPWKQQKIHQAQVLPVSASLSCSFDRLFSSSDTPSNVVPDVSSHPIIIAEVLTSTFTTAQYAPYPTRYQRVKSVDLTSQFASPSTLPVYSRSNPTWVSLRLSPRACTRTWYVVSGHRAIPNQSSSLNSSCFAPKLPEILEETSGDESLDIGSERQVHFEDSVTVYSYDSDRDHSIEIKSSFCPRELNKRV